MAQIIEFENETRAPISTYIYNGCHLDKILTGTLFAASMADEKTQLNAKAPYCLDFVQTTASNLELLE